MIHSKNHSNRITDIIVMFIIMILSGLLSTMNIWADKRSDIRWSLNDLYMAILMTGWMFLFMGLYYKDFVYGSLGSVLIVISFLAIRNQWFIDLPQYISGMIPHHSMAVFMTRKISEKTDISKLPNELSALLTNIFTSQQKEIDLMKSF